MKTGSVEPQEWWASLSAGERRLICSVVQMLRGAKRSQLRDVARAAVKWERGLGCFIKVRLMNARHGRRAGESRWLRIEGDSQRLKSGKLTGLRVASARQEAEIGAGLTAENARNAEV